MYGESVVNFSIIIFNEHLLRGSSVVTYVPAHGRVDKISEANWRVTNAPKNNARAKMMVKTNI
jgi:hypothetical protein